METLQDGKGLPRVGIGEHGSTLVLTDVYRGLAEVTLVDDPWPQITKGGLLLAHSNEG